MNPKCIICNRKADFLLIKDGYYLFRCPKCSLVFVHPQPSFKTLKKEVYSVSAGYQSGKAQDLSKVKEHPNNIKVLEYFEKNRIKGKLLDVGCSNGEFMFSAKKRGFEVFGVELNPATARIAKANKLNVVIGTLDRAKFKINYFDVIFLGDVIEHMSDPRALLEQCHTLLKSSGIITIITPNLDCFWAKATFWLFIKLKIPWSSVTPPFHLFQFSTLNLESLLKLSKFEPVKVWYNPPPPLSYELWFTGLANKYSKNKDVVNFLKYYLVYLIYGFFYLFNKLISKLLGKDNGLVIVSKKL